MGFPSQAGILTTDFVSGNNYSIFLHRYQVQMVIWYETGENNSPSNFSAEHILILLEPVPKRNLHRHFVPHPTSFRLQHKVGPNPGHYKHLKNGHF